MMKSSFATIGVLALMTALSLSGSGTVTWFNGVASYEPGSTYDAPIFRQFAFVDGQVTQYHVLSPELFRVDNHRTQLYQFPLCRTLEPVLERHDVVPGEGSQLPHDAPTRQIVDVVLSTGCMEQPRSEAEVFELALTVTPRELMWINAPIIPATHEDLPDNLLFNAPPHRPRIDAWQEGVAVKFITYEASWFPTWVASNFPADDADVFMISYGAMFRPGFTIFNTAAGSPNTDSVQSYSPIWLANCIVDADNQKCNISVNLRDPFNPATGNGYFQCKSVAECVSMKNGQGHQVLQVAANTITHIDCPMLAVDLTRDNYIDPAEEIAFPDLFVDGPVIV